jgi:hypothetical protein
MAVYVEYISRRPGIAIEGFRQIAGRGQGSWASAYDTDRLIVNIGRTWRLGPEPEYLAIWHTPSRGLERLGEWAAIFASHEADHIELPFEAVGRIDRAALMDPLVEPVPGRGGPLYVVEYFEPVEGATATEVGEEFEQRRASWADAVLNLAALRVGTLGPDPSGLAVWQLPGYDHLEPFVRNGPDQADGAVRVVTTGLYADVGEEIL